MSSTPTGDGQRSAKRIKLSIPDSTEEDGLGRSGVSATVVLDRHTPPPSRSRSKSRGVPAASAASGMRASTGSLKTDISRAGRAAADMVADVFSPTVNGRPSLPAVLKTPIANGVATPSPTLSNNTPQATTAATTHNNNTSNSDSPRQRRHVSGPGQFTPRALLKNEEEFEEAGINSATLLSLVADEIPWWIAEQIVWLHQYLESPQKGEPTSLNARPHGRLKSAQGRDIAHCCSVGGLTHLKPCNMSISPPAAEAFDFAADLRNDLLAQHHASKGGINTIAYVGDLVLEMMAGMSQIDEEEFKLLSGSEHIRQYHGRGYKRYKAADPHVDPTKQPILFLKSLKKLAQHDDLVSRLKARYTWALINYQHLIGAVSPSDQLLAGSGFFPQSSASRLSSSTQLNPTSAPPPPRRERKGNASVQRRKIEVQAVTPAREEVVHDARSTRRPDFPLKGLTENESAHATGVIWQICGELDEMFRSLPVDYSPSPPENLKSRPKQAGQAPSAAKRGGNKETSTFRKRGSTDEGADLLLSLANGGFHSSGDDVSDHETAIEDDPLSVPFELNVKLQMDQVLKTLIETAVNNHIRLFSHHDAEKRCVRLNPHLRKLKQLFAQVDLKCNIIATPAYSNALLQLLEVLAGKTATYENGSESSLRAMNRRSPTHSEVHKGVTP